MAHPTDILKKYWGYAQFRPLQEDIIQSVLKGQDTLALMPTGGGKSICFQVPALMKEGICLVVTPLIALMKDQVANLRSRNIPAAAIYAGMYYQDVEKLLEEARRGSYKFLYVSPERLQSKRFLEYCDGMPVSLLAIDEAHCISQWGYDFRPAYLEIAEIRTQFPGVPVLALTASATPKVQVDICEKLRMQKPAVFTKSFVRSNLSYSIIEEADKQPKILHILNRVPGSAIIYCRNRKGTRELADMLEQQGISASYYHAGLTGEERTARQELWLEGRIRVMVCTNAFGMGIDKPDVRIVIHADAPESLEAYYQEAGRGGRDEQKAYGVLLYHSSELDRMLEMLPLQFPGQDQVRVIYQALVNYLQVPIGSAEGVYYDFDINDFVQKFELNITLAYSALRILEQEGVLQLSESVFMPSMVEFIVNRQTLFAFDDTQPAFSALIQTLLRTYEGIFDNPVPIYEKQLMRIMRVKELEVVQGLQQLQQRGIIRFKQRKSVPQLCFVQERISSQLLRIDADKVKERMKAYQDRLNAMLDYVKNEDRCRTQVIVNYFGEKDAKPCGICDVCIAQKKKPVDFKVVSAGILSKLTSVPLPWKSLQEELADVDEKDLQEVLQYLIHEEAIIRDESGNLYLP
jgi:ATP-dependent DNA helicase RecQ